MVIFHSSVSLPEGNSQHFYLEWANTPCLPSTCGMEEQRSNRKQSESQRNRHPRSPGGQRGRPGMIRIDGNCSPTREPSLTCIIHQHSNGGNSPILRLTHKRSFSVDALLFFHLLSGKRLHSYLENGPVEIVDLPMNSMVDLSIVSGMFTEVYPNHYPIKSL